jgi:hypothetical protein
MLLYALLRGLLDAAGAAGESSCTEFAHRKEDSCERKDCGCAVDMMGFRERRWNVHSTKGSMCAIEMDERSFLKESTSTAHTIRTPHRRPGITQDSQRCAPVYSRMMMRIVARGRPRLWISSLLDKYPLPRSV